MNSQVAPELQLWQQLSAEMCRQVHLECSERGQLLQAAVDRQQSLLHQALACCDRLYEVLLLSAASHQQEHEDMLTAQHEAQVLQQDNNRLKVRRVVVALGSFSVRCWDMCSGEPLGRPCLVRNHPRVSHPSS